MHEYGHTIDSRAKGPSYLYIVGIPIQEIKNLNLTNYSFFRFEDISYFIEDIAKGVVAVTANVIGGQ